jgi:hypothetical protein
MAAELMLMLSFTATACCPLTLSNVMQKRPDRKRQFWTGVPFFIAQALSQPSNDFNRANQRERNCVAEDFTALHAALTCSPNLRLNAAASSKVRKQYGTVFAGRSTGIPTGFNIGYGGVREF